LDMLVFLAGLQQGQRHRLAADVTSLGRDRGNDLVIDDESASRRHCVLERRGRDVFIVDGGSTNGTCLNYRRVTESKLSDGDRIGIGETLILFRSDAKRESLATIRFREASERGVTTDFRLEATEAGLAPMRTDESFRLLYGFLTRISGVLTLGKLFDLTLEGLLEATPAAEAVALLADDSGALVPRASRFAGSAGGEGGAGAPEGGNAAGESGTIQVSADLSRHAMEKGEAVLAAGKDADAGEAGSIIAAPLKVQDRALGLVYLATAPGGAPFTRADLEIAAAMALGTAQAIENTRLYERLMNATEYTSAILRSLSGGLVVVDRELVVGKTNEAALRLLEIEELELTGHKLAAVKGFGEMAALLAEVIGSGQPSERNEIVVERNGHETPLGISVSPLEDAAGRIIGAVANFRDLAEIKRLAAFVERSRRLAALGEMAAGVAHEVRNPLNSIRGFAQLLGEEDPVRRDPKAAEYLGIIIEEVDRMNGIVSDLLDFARQRELTLARTDVASLLRALAGEMAPAARAARVEIVCEPATSLPPARANADKLKQVFLNVAKNGIEAMPKGGRLSIQAKVVPAAPGGEEMAVAISDTGEGIAPAILPLIFNPFFTEKDRGTGLGLSICQKIVEAHGGRIEAASELGKGSTFTVYLPLDGQGASASGK